MTGDMVVFQPGDSVLPKTGVTGPHRPGFEVIDGSRTDGRVEVKALDGQTYFYPAAKLELVTEPS